MKKPPVKKRPFARRELQRLPWSYFPTISATGLPRKTQEKTIRPLLTPVLGYSRLATQLSGLRLLSLYSGVLFYYPILSKIVHAIEDTRYGGYFVLPLTTPSLARSSGVRD